MDRHAKLEKIRGWFYTNSAKDLWFKIVSQHATPSTLALEIGSGSGMGNQNQLYPSVAETIGIDLDERVLKNPHLDKAFCGSAFDLPVFLPGRKFDLIYSHMVAEHIEDGEKFISVQLEALADGGVIIHSTVSKFYWVSMMNGIVPERLKDYLILKLGSGRTSEDIFPAFYALNSRSQIKTICSKLGARLEIIRQDEPPGYLRRSFILMIIYTMIHKPLQLLFPALRPTFCFIIRKP